MDTRRAKTLRARAVLRARRKGFLTPEVRRYGFSAARYGAPQWFDASRIRITPIELDCEGRMKWPVGDSSKAPTEQQANAAMLEMVEGLDSVGG